MIQAGHWRRGHVYGEANIVRQGLASTLKPGDIVVIANLPAHKRNEVRTSSKQLVPPCTTCPDFNPIEQSFAKLKGALYDRIGQALKAFQPHDHNYFRKADMVQPDRTLL
jgi:hypothetical protein